MKTKAASRPVKWAHVSALTLIVLFTLFAIKPWNAWKNTNPDFYGWNVFSYFTVQSNIIAAAVYCITIIGLFRHKSMGDWFRYVRGAAVLYMLVTGLVYTFLLQNNPDVNPTLGFDWNNFVLHQLGPLFIVAWWLLWPSRKPVSPRAALWWLIFPILWIIYTLIRAHFVHWYPYPFLNPAKVGGAGNVAWYILGIAAGFILLSQVVAWASRVRARGASPY
ncbi:MAG TPA: Pr6Pr family membrane protein [Candidatus Saccharimonadales bacterium]|nr:Pr6Pr family membrane protein [Candidatus Saccharimonadales bacterium]